MAHDSFKDDPARRLVETKIRELRLDMATLSRGIGKNPTYVQQYLTKGSPKWLPEGPRELLATMLGVSPEELREPRYGEFPAGRSVQHSPLYKQISTVSPSPGTDRLPVFGTGEAGTDGEAEWNGDIVEYVARPEALTGVPGAYAAYVHHESMLPRYRHGELVYMHPSRPYARGSYVFVQLGEPSDDSGPTRRALIKEYIRQTSTKLILSQLNPPKQIEIPLDRVKRIHRIVASGEP